VQYPKHIYTKSLKQNVTTKAKFTEHLRKKLTPFWKHTCTAKHQAWAFYTMIGNLFRRWTGNIADKNSQFCYCCTKVYHALFEGPQ
jgi:hypothetical protein